MHVRPPIRNTQYAIRNANQARALPRGTSRLLLVRDHLSYLHQGQLHPGLYLELLPRSLRVGLLGRLGRQLLKVRTGPQPAAYLGRRATRPWHCGMGVDGRPRSCGAPLLARL